MLPGSRRARADTGFQALLQRMPLQGQLTGQDSMPKHLESHRTFGGWARGLRQREGRRPIIHDARSAWFVRSHKMFCDISQG